MTKCLINNLSSRQNICQPCNYAASPLVAWSFTLCAYVSATTITMSAAPWLKISLRPDWRSFKWPFRCLYIWHPWWPHPPPTAPPSQPAPPPPSPWLSSPNPTAPHCWPPWRRRALPSLPATPAPSQWALLSPTLTLLLHHIVDLIDDPGCPPVDLLVHHHPHLICHLVDLFAN